MNEMCPYCDLNTAGQHQINCPLSPTLYGGDPRVGSPSEYKPDEEWMNAPLGPYKEDKASVLIEALEEIAGQLGGSHVGGDGDEYNCSDCEDMIETATEALKEYRKDK